MLDIISLTVSAGNRAILRDINVHIPEGKTIALFGPNGSGKTTLLNAVMGFPGYAVESGRIIFNGKDITSLPTDQRAMLGIGLSFQRPPSILGVKLGELAGKIISRSRYAGTVSEFAENTNMTALLQRDVNKGFSGGEVKRSELLQLLSQSPSLVLLDEPDSGVDLVSVKMVADVINRLLERDRPPEERKKSGLIITHAGHILDYVEADEAYVMIDGAIYCTGKPADVLNDIKSKGYEGCVTCRA